MRPEQDIKLDIKQTKAEMAASQKRLQELDKELASCQKMSQKEKLFQALSPLGVQVQDKKWTKWSDAKNAYTHWDPYNKRHVVPSLFYQKKASFQGIRLYADLARFSHDQWTLEYHFDNYGTAWRKGRLFTGSETEALEWAKKELTDKLLQVKKKLQKELALHN